MNVKRLVKQIRLASSSGALEQHDVSRLVLKLALGLSVTAVTLPTTSIAQEESPTLEEIIVTGSHIRKDTFSSSSPVSVVDAAAIEGIGAVNIGELMNRLPSVTGDITGSSANVNDPQSSGINTTALRNLGSSRTLVLVNGRRYVSGVSAGAGYGVDLNTIPTTMIERIDVLTGGQSAAYGSDAVAGVVNIITKTDFEGVALDVQVGESTEGDREKQDVSLTIGKNFDDGNVWFSFGHSNDEGLLSSDREFSEFSQRSIDTDGDELFDSLAFEGSSFIPETRLIGPSISIKGDGSPFDGGRDIATSDRLNFNEFRSLQIPLRRNFAAGGVTLDISEKAKAIVEVNYAQVESRARFEPIPLSVANDVYRINRGGTSGMDLATHPLWVGSSAGTQLLADGATTLDDVTTFRRTVELGGRGSGNTRTTFRLASAFDYEITDNLYFNLYGTYGVTEQNQTDFGDINLERARLALDFEPDGAGGFQCADPVARINGCVPYNPFNTVDSVAGQAGIVDISPAAVDYLSAAVGLEGEVEQMVVSGVLSGDLPFSVGTTGDNIGFAVGVEYREEQGEETPDGLRQKGITRGFKIQPTGGEFDVVDIFGEINIPILPQLSLDAAFRVGDYSSVGSTTTWKVGLDAPINDSFRIRAATSTAVRAPNISDLFAGAVANASLQTDPCGDITNADGGNIATNCRSIAAIQNRIDTTGAFTLTQVESQNILSFNSGSEEVGEEEADSFTIGVIFTPTAVENLSIAVDFYDIEIEDAIRVPTGTEVLARCHDVDPASFDPTCGGLVFRDPNSGPVLDVNGIANNEDTIETSGLDLEVSYVLDVGPGSLYMGLGANYLDTYEVTGLAGDKQDFKGEVLFPELRFNVNLSYDLNNFNVYTQLRYWDETVDRNDDNPHNSDLNEFDSIVYVDLRASFQITDSFNVYIGTNNLFDEDPEDMGFTHKYFQQGTNTNGTAFDTTGRQWYAGIKSSF
ncbi:MAG: TonB-dependent receptor plug domain-containing protein [Pseudomonadales bacterium]